MYKCVCVLAHLWPQMHVNVTQFLLASFDLSLFPWQQKQAPARQLTEADNMKWVGEMSEENDSILCICRGVYVRAAKLHVSVCSLYSCFSLLVLI